MGLKLLEASGKEFEVIHYLENTPTFETLKNIIGLLGIRPMELIRKNEPVWKSTYKNKSLTDTELIQIMVENPKLMERPIVINGNKAVIGRPSEKIQEIL